MKIKEGYELVNRSGQFVIVGKSNDIPLNNTIVLAETAVFLWKLLKERDLTKTQMLDELIGAFDISTVLALSDIDIFVKTMTANGILE